MNGFVAATGTLPMMDVWIAKNQAVHASRVYQWWVTAGGCAYPIMQAQTNAIILVDAPTRPMTMLEFVQSMTEGGGQWENLVVMRDAKIKVEMLQPWVAHQYSLSKDFLQAKHKDTNIPTMMEPFSPPAAWFWWTSVHHPRESKRTGLDKPSSKGFSRINKLKEKIIYFYSLSVNYNNQSLIVGNDSKNSIHCYWRAAIIYELTQFIVTNNSMPWIYF